MGLTVHMYRAISKSWVFLKEKNAHATHTYTHTHQYLIMSTLERIGLQEKLEIPTFRFRKSVHMVSFTTAPATLQQKEVCSSVN